MLEGVGRDYLAEPVFSHESGSFEQEEEWAFLLGCWVEELGVKELAQVPELEPVEIVRAHLNVVVHAAMIEEELLVAPMRADGVRSAHDPANQFFFAAELGGFVEGEHLEHCGVHRDDGHLVLEVVLVLIRPAIHVVRLDVQLVGPVRVLLFDTVLVELGDLHNGGSADVISDGRKVLHDGLPGTPVVGLSQNGRPSVLEEVKGFVAVEGEHGDPIGRAHAVSEPLDAVSWHSLGNLWCRRYGVRDAHETVLASSEDTGVGRVGVRDVLYLGHSAHGMCHFDSLFGHAVRDYVVRVVHILVEKGLELRTTEEQFSCLVHEDILPELLLFADGRLGLILWCVALQGVLGELAVLVWIVIVPLGVVVAPVVRVGVRLGRVVFLAGRVFVPLQFLHVGLLHSAWALHTSTLKSTALMVSWLIVVAGLNVVQGWVLVMNWVDMLVDFLYGLSLWLFSNRF